MKSAYTSIMLENVISEIRKHIEKDVLHLWPEAKGVSFDSEEPNVEDHGDVSVNIALVLAKKLGKPPMDIASEFVAHVIEQKWYKDICEKVEVKRPGFVNFFFDADVLAKGLPKYVSSIGKPGKEKKKIVIEHTNVNPNKAMHIGHLRNSVLGDVITRVLSRTGYKTEVQYYVDDTGLQVADTYVGLKELNMTQDPDEKFDHFCWRVYTTINKKYETEPKLLEKRVVTLRELEKSDSRTAKEVKDIAKRILNDHLKTTADFGIMYDLLVWESDVLAFGFWDTAFTVLKKSPDFIQETHGKNAGCWVIKTGVESKSDDHSHDKVIVKSDGTVTYTGKDIAYHLWKFNVLGKDFLYKEWVNSSREAELFTTAVDGKKAHAYGHADAVYNVIDVRQSYPQAMVKLALETLGFQEQARELKHISYGVVSLTPKTAKELGLTIDDEKQAYSMSGRKGIGIKADDLLTAVEKKVAAQEYEVTSTRATQIASSRDIAVGAIKYYMLRYNPHTDIVFDYKDALSLEGNTGPYIQYAHARAAGILDKAGVKKIKPLTATDISREERRLVTSIYRWPEIIRIASQDLNVNGLTTYAFELANRFNGFYEAKPVLKAEGAVKEQRLALVNAFKETIGDVLHLLGITAPDKM